jgi:hypothetical protein
VEGSNVLKRDENVAVQLEVRDALDSAVGGQRAVLVLAPEELDLDLLALVLVRVVLHRPERSGTTGNIRVVPAVQAVKCRPRVVPVWSRTARYGGLSSAREPILVALSIPLQALHGNLTSWPVLDLSSEQREQDWPERAGEKGAAS